MPLHPVVVDHLRKLVGSFSDTVFPWDYDQRTLWVQFHRLQDAAKVKPAGKTVSGYTIFAAGSPR